MELSEGRIRVEGERIRVESKTVEEMKQVYEKETDAEMKQAYFEMYTEMKRIPGREEWACDWSIIRKSDQTMIGGVGFKGVPDSKGIVEIGYGIDEAYQNQGYATEAVKVMLAWALAQEDVLCVQAQTDPNNMKSQKVLKKNGFQPAGQGTEGPMFEVCK